MGSFSIWHGMVLGLIGLFVGVPSCAICKKAGYPFYAGLLVCIPIVGVFAFWFFAFSHWPVLRNRQGEI
jgi:hypothetical protein